MSRDIRFFFGVMLLVTVGFTFCMYLLESSGDSNFPNLPLSWLQVGMYIFGSTPSQDDFFASRNTWLTAIVYVLCMVRDGKG